MLFRFILLSLLGYFLWKIVSGVIRAMGTPQERSGGPVRGNARQQRSSQAEFKDVKDAEFEDITPTKGRQNPQ